MRRTIQFLSLLVLTSMLSPVTTMAYIGQVKGYLGGDLNAKVGEQFTTKLMMDSGVNKISVVYVNLNVDLSKVRVKSVTMNKNVFGNVFLEKESGGVVSLYGTSSKPSDQLPKGSVEVATIVMEAVSAGSATLSTKNFEITGPSNTSDFSYEWKWQGSAITIGSNEVVPTSTPVVGDGNSGILKFKVSFAGVNSQAACANDWPVNVVVRSNSASKTYNNVTVRAVESEGQLKSYEGEVLLSGISETSGLAVFVKGPRHLQVKYGENGQDYFYNQAGGKVSVSKDSSSTQLQDFTKYPLQAGDVTGASGEQDGAVDGLDFSYVKSEVNKRSEGDNLAADLNGNCKLESQDLTLLMLAMKERQEQLY